MKGVVMLDACAITRPRECLPSFLALIRPRFTATQGSLLAADVGPVWRMAEDSSKFVPSPSTHLEQPNVVEFEKGKAVHRIYKLQYLGNEFNPCRGGATRFAPIHDQKQNCIPTLYAADTTQAAIYETIFHDVPLDSDLKSVPITILRGYQQCALILNRPLHLASLRAPDLMKWGVTRTALIASSSDHYRDTIKWAQRVHVQFSELDGTLWMSNQCDPNSAFLLLGDRVKSSELIVQNYRNISEETFLDDVRRAAQRSNILLTM